MSHATESIRARNQIAEQNRQNDIQRSQNMQTLFSSLAKIGTDIADSLSTQTANDMTRSREAYLLQNNDRLQYDDNGKPLIEPDDVRERYSMLTDEWMENYEKEHHVGFLAKNKFNRSNRTSMDESVATIIKNNQIEVKNSMKRNALTEVKNSLSNRDIVSEGKTADDLLREYIGIEDPQQFISGIMESGDEYYKKLLGDLQKETVLSAYAEGDQALAMELSKHMNRDVTAKMLAGYYTLVQAGYSPLDAQTEMENMRYTFASNEMFFETSALMKAASEGGEYNGRTWTMKEAKDQIEKLKNSVLNEGLPGFATELNPNGTLDNTSAEKFSASIAGQVASAEAKWQETNQNRMADLVEILTYGENNLSFITSIDDLYLMSDMVGIDRDYLQGLSGWEKMKMSIEKNAESMSLWESISSLQNIKSYDEFKTSYRWGDSEAASEAYSKYYSEEFAKAVVNISNNTELMRKLREDYGYSLANDPSKNRTFQVSLEDVMSHEAFFLTDAKAYSTDFAAQKIAEQQSKNLLDWLIDVESQSSLGNRYEYALSTIGKYNLKDTDSTVTSNLVKLKSNNTSLADTIESLRQQNYMDAMPKGSDPEEYAKAYGGEQPIPQSMIEVKKGSVSSDTRKENENAETIRQQNYMDAMPEGSDPETYAKGYEGSQPIPQSMIESKKGSVAAAERKIAEENKEAYRTNYLTDLYYSVPNPTTETMLQGVQAWNAQNPDNKIQDYELTSYFAKIGSAEHQESRNANIASLQEYIEKNPGASLNDIINEGTKNNLSLYDVQSIMGASYGKLIAQEAKDSTVSLVKESIEKFKDMSPSEWTEYIAGIDDKAAATILNTIRQFGTENKFIADEYSMYMDDVIDLLYDGKATLDKDNAYRQLLARQFIDRYGEEVGKVMLYFDPKTRQQYESFYGAVFLESDYDDFIKNDWGSGNGTAKTYGDFWNYLETKSYFGFGDYEWFFEGKDLNSTISSNETEALQSIIMLTVSDQRMLESVSTMKNMYDYYAGFQYTNGGVTVKETIAQYKESAEFTINHQNALNDPNRKYALASGDGYTKSIWTEQDKAIEYMNYMTLLNAAWDTDPTRRNEFKVYLEAQKRDISEEHYELLKRISDNDVNSKLIAKGYDFDVVGALFEKAKQFNDSVTSDDKNSIYYNYLLDDVSDKIQILLDKVANSEAPFNLNDEINEIIEQAASRYASKSASGVYAQRYLTDSSGNNMVIKSLNSYTSSTGYQYNGPAWFDSIPYSDIVTKCENPEVPSVAMWDSLVSNINTFGIDGGVTDASSNLNDTYRSLMYGTTSQRYDDKTNYCLAISVALQQCGLTEAAVNESSIDSGAHFDIVTGALRNLSTEDQVFILETAGYYCSVADAMAKTTGYNYNAFSDCIPEQNGTLVKNGLTVRNENGTPYVFTESGRQIEARAFSTSMNPLTRAKLIGFDVDGKSIVGSTDKRMSQHPELYTPIDEYNKALYALDPNSDQFFIVSLVASNPAFPENLEPDYRNGTYEEYAESVEATHTTSRGDNISYFVNGGGSGTWESSLVVPGNKTEDIRMEQFLKRRKGM